MNILVTGIVGSGKTKFVEEGVRVWNEYANLNDHFPATPHSLGDLYREIARDTFGATEERAAMLEPTAMMAINANLLERAIVEYGLLRPGSVNTIIESPLTILRADLRTVLKFSMQRLEHFHGQCPISHIVCLVPSVKDVKDSFTRNNLSDAHPTDDKLILGWVAMEVMVSQILAGILKVPLTIIPPKYGRDSKDALPESAGETIAKILFDRQYRDQHKDDGGLPPEIYFAHPISSIRKLEKSDDGKGNEMAAELRKAISDFRRKLREHAIVVDPIELDDSELTAEHQGHTFHRDLYWFVHNTGMTVAYFPEPKESKISIGVNRELSEAIIIGKPFAFVAEGREDLGKLNPFSAMPPANCQFSRAKDFFDQIRARQGLPNPFKRLTAKDGTPRYEKLLRCAIQAR
jgi:hypothetical protein